MTRDQVDQFEYDVAVSFASQDKAVAEELFNLLRHKNREVFRDEYTPADEWGKDVLDHLVIGAEGRYFSFADENML